MKFEKKFDIEDEFLDLFETKDQKSVIEHETKVLMSKFLNEIESRTEEKKINRKKLASLIGTSVSYITQLFRGDKVINLETLAKFQEALDFTFEIRSGSNDYHRDIDEFYLLQSYKKHCTAHTDLWSYKNLEHSTSEIDYSNVPAEPGFEKTAV